MIHYRDGGYHEGPVPMDPQGEALRYGFGFFETVFWNGSGACRLERHLARAHASLDAFGLGRRSLDYHTVVPEVARRNGLADATARVNILYPVEGGVAVPVVCAAPYTPPPPDKVLRLEVSPRPVHTWLGAHKSMNYLYYHLEHKRALEAGYDGAALADPHGSLLETATAALLFEGPQGVVSPLPPDTGEAAPGILPSIALEAAGEVLDIARRPMLLDELSGFSHAWALNSLTGMVPVGRLGATRYAVDRTPCAAVSCRIFSS